MKKLWDLKKLFSHLEPEGQVWARHNHGSDMPTSARAILHHTDQKGPNIMHPSVTSTDLLFICSQSTITLSFYKNEP